MLVCWWRTCRAAVRDAAAGQELLIVWWRGREEKRRKEKWSCWLAWRAAGIELLLYGCSSRCDSRFSSPNSSAGLDFSLSAVSRVSPLSLDHLSQSQNLSHSRFHSFSQSVSLSLGLTANATGLLQWRNEGINKRRRREKEEVGRCVGVGIVVGLVWW